MSSKRPPTSGYARLEQYESDPEDEAEVTSQIRLSEDLQYAPIQPARNPRVQYQGSRSTSWKSERGTGRSRSNSAIDIKALNYRLEKWADEIAQKFKIRKVQGKTQDEEKLEIHHSVFQAPEGMAPAPSDSSLMDTEGRMSKMEFDDVVESVRVAIEMGMHPLMISKGSSGSYFAKNSQGKVVGVFKPKDEEPYATKNPKWTKWIHRNLFPFAFGRACLIPNLSYVSEAAAYVLDARLQTNIVPYTDIVEFSSISFNYDYWDRKAFYRKKKPLPPKIGSLQVFLKGFKDASIFLKEHPWPEQVNGSIEAGPLRKSKKRGWTAECRTGGEQSDDEEDHRPRQGRSQSRGRRAFWTPALQLSLREELEKLVILDYIMRNTDRGLDNWMIRIDEDTQKATIVTEAPGKEGNPNGHGDPYMRREEPMSTSSAPSPEPRSGPKVALGAIDNSLSWPWKHPDAVSHINQAMPNTLTFAVAKLSLRLAFSTGVSYRPTIHRENSTAFFASTHLQAMVERDTSRTASLLQPRCRLSRKDVCATDCRYEGPSLERCRNLEGIQPGAVRTHEASTGVHMG